MWYYRMEVLFKVAILRWESELSVNEGWMDEYMNEQNIVQNFPGLGIN